MPIRLSRFGGIIPKLNPEKLPDEAAQVATNCDLTAGVLAPIAVATPFSSMLTDAGVLDSGIPSADLVRITKPDAPYKYSVTHMCRPYWWARLYIRTWVTYIDPSGRGGNGEFTVTNIDTQGPLTPNNIEYDETGIYLTFVASPFTYTFQPGTQYQVHGPKYQFKLNSSTYLGGPNSTIRIPDMSTWTDPELPLQSVPLYYYDDAYGFWQAVDVSGPNFHPQGGGIINIPKEYDATTYRYPDLDEEYQITFKINLNYAQSSRRHYYYAQSMVTEDGQEGPPSEISNRVVVKPGEIPRIATPRVSGYGKNNLYRSASGGENSFFLLDDVNSDYYSDSKDIPQNVALPPFGNYPDCNASEFLAGSLIHPSQFGVAFYEDTLYMSDFYRLHVWPDEYTVPFQDTITMIAMSGSTIVVFAGDNVFGVSGGDPEFMSNSLITDTAPLLNAKGICRIGQTLIYPSHDGLMAVTGGSITNLTKEHFTRTEWGVYSPASMVAKTADNSIFLEGDGGNLRIDLDEGISSVTSYTATSGASLTWKSKRFRFDQKTIFDYAKIVAEGDVTLNIYTNRVLVKTVTVENSRPVELTGLSHALEWEFEVSSSSIIREMTFYERSIQPAGASVSLTPANTPLWESTWLMFPDRGRFAAGLLRRQVSGSVPVKFYQDGVTLVDTETVSDGHIFSLPRDMAKATYWRISVDTDAPVEELILFMRDTVPVGDVIHEVYSGDGVPPWLIKRYEIANTRRIKSVIVDASTPVTMNIYRNDAVDAVDTVTISDSTEVRLSDYGDFGVFEFDFNGKDHLVREVTVYAQAIQPVGTEPVYLSCIASRRGMMLKFADRGAFAAVSVAAEDYSSISLRLYADGSLVHTATISSGGIVVLPSSLSEASLWEVDITSPAQVDSVLLIPRSRVPIEGATIRLVARDGAYFPWIGPRFEFSTPTELRSVIVEADSYPITLKLRPEGGSERSYTLSNRYEAPLDDTGAVTAVELDFDGADRLVNGVWLFGKDVMPVQNNGLIIRSGGGIPSWRRKVVAFSDTGSFSAVRVVADDYTGMELRLLTDGVVRETVSISDDSDTKLESTLPNSREWEFDLVHHGQVRELHLIGRMRYSVKSGTVIIRRDQEPFTWLDRRIIAPAAMQFTSGRVSATAYPLTLTLFHEGVEKTKFIVHDDKPFRLPRVRPERTLELDVEAEESGTMIEEVALSSSMEGLYRG